ncbi:CLUMA_CG015100, isoform A [Clunio marinus]|uniref:CLUMA_CG015100, isoform A n=1 Tax=Clunio marinus TaxID=568069 RepID=A0A1J1IQQ5_9DIPT|nr:CLUMA_CG015100, isoform A [Clunio marinus]
MKLIFCFVVIFLVATDAQRWRRSSNGNNNNRITCPDTCDDDFDEVVCAYNGEDQRMFMGTCRMEQYNQCYGDNYEKINQNKCRMN